ncbi:DUF885 domain-containing protein [Lachnospiraceae bacterium JLR.KK009]|nr:DUF885 domain-containing protein [Lachnospiraceae bacterium]
MMETKIFWEKCRLRKGKIRGKIRLLALAAFFILLAGCGGNGGSKEEFSAYLNQIFRSEVTGSTLNMHYNLAHPENYGITDYKVTYGNVSAGRDTEAAAVLENWKKNLKRFRKKDLPVSQQMAYDILEDYILQELPAGKFSLYQEILKPSTGFQSQLPVLLAEYKFYDEKDVQDYLELMAETPALFRKIMDLERIKAEKGLFMADFAVDDVVAQCRSFTQDPANNYLLSTFDDRVDEAGFLTPEQAEQYKQVNRQIVTGEMVPAYQRLAEELSALKGSGKNSGGLCGLKGGREYYEYLVKDTTGSGMSVEEMRAQTEAQRKQDLAELAQIAKNHPDIGQKCVNYQLPTEEPELILKDLQRKMQQDFPSPPEVSFQVKEVHPSLEEYTAPAFYLTPPIDDVSQNCIYINKSKGDEKIQLYTTLAHEGFPGHLYQNVMERSCGLEPIRSLFGSSGYVEGWATYVEMQSYYYADVEQDVSAFLQKNQSALLSLYATADMGIHYDGWTLRDTIDFFASYQIADKATIQQIYQLIVEEPAHYLKYYIGYLEFLNLKEYAKEKFKEDYSDYKFHAALMEMGNAPFYILKEYLPEYY